MKKLVNHENGLKLQVIYQKASTKRLEEFTKMTYEQFSTQIDILDFFSWIFKSAQILYHDLLEACDIVVSFQKWVESGSQKRDGYKPAFLVPVALCYPFQGEKNTLVLTFLRARECLEGSSADYHLSYL